MVKILHFADAHIDIATHGPYDPDDGLFVRVKDFLKSLDAIVAAAIEEKVDLVIFAGDAYKDRSPAPTYQREWGKRIMRLSRAGIPTILITGNHDVSPSQKRAHAIQEFSTLDVPHVVVVDRPRFLEPKDLEGLPVQVLGIPWVTPSLVKNAAPEAAEPNAELDVIIENAVTVMIQQALEQRDPALPFILAAHASIRGALIGDERTIKLGRDVQLSQGLVRDPRIDYVALGHIHRFQDLNPGGHPPVIYAGSIERVDFGEAGDDKGYVIAEVSRGETHYTWHKLATRPYRDLSVTLRAGDNAMEKILAALPQPEELEGAIVRLNISYPDNADATIDDAQIRERARLALELKINKIPKFSLRARLGENGETQSMTPEELLKLYWKQNHTDESEIDALQALGERIIHADEAEAQP
ncbi:MAG: exonuclease SbcCD subunit D [Anaerolineaceae bacterium]